MNITFRLRRATLLLALALPGLCWGFVPSQALIVTDAPGDPDEGAVIPFLSGRLVAAGYAVTTNVGVPGGLSTYKQIWDVRFQTALSVPDITAYTAYLAAGGALFAMGENGGCCGVRDTSVIALITAAGGGTPTVEIASQSAQTVDPPFTGPTPLATYAYGGAGGFLTKGSGAFVTTDMLGNGAGLVFAPGTLTNDPAGTLVTILDVNFMDTTSPAFVSQPLTDNLIAFLAAPTPVGGPPPSATPIPSSAILALTGLVGLALYRHRRLRTTSRDHRERWMPGFFTQAL